MRMLDDTDRTSNTQSFASAPMLRKCCPHFLIIVFSTIGASTNSAETGRNLPSLSEHSKPTICDLGILRPSSKHNFRFQFRNSKNFSATIIGGTSTCGCSKLNFETTEIAALQSIWVTGTVSTSSAEGDFQFSIRLATRRTGTSASREPEYIDEFQFNMKLRKECSFVPAFPLLSTISSANAKPFQVRVINYSPRKWLRVNAQFSDPDIQCSLSDETEVIDGQSRQIVVISIDRTRLAQLANEGRIGSGQAVLSVFAASTADPSTSDKIGECEVSIRITKSVSVHPNIVNWNPNSPRDILLIVTCRDTSLSKQDFELSIGDSEITAFSFEQLEGGWGKLTIRSSALSAVTGASAKLRIKVPARNYSESILLRLATE